MKIMHVITRFILGGAQENTLYTVEGQHALPEHEVMLVTGPAIGPEGELLKRAERSGVNTVVLTHLRRAICPYHDSLAFLQLCRLMSEFRPDVVHTHSSKAGVLGRLAARVCRVPVVVHTIHGLPFHPYQCALLNWGYVLLERWCARYTDKLITVADAMTRQASWKSTTARKCATDMGCRGRIWSSARSHGSATSRVTCSSLTHSRKWRGSSRARSSC